MGKMNLHISIFSLSSLALSLEYLPICPLCISFITYPPALIMFCGWDQIDYEKVVDEDELEE